MLSFGIANQADLIKTLLDVLRVCNFCANCIYTSLQLNPAKAIAEFVFYVGFVLTMLTQIFLPCFFGNEIALKSGSIPRAVYCSNWPNGSRRYRKLVLVYMAMLKKPKRLVVGQLFSLTLDSFLSVLNRAYSMYAVVQSFAE